MNANIEMKVLRGYITAQETIDCEFISLTTEDPSTGSIEATTRRDQINTYCNGLTSKLARRQYKRILDAWNEWPNKNEAMDLETYCKAHDWAPSTQQLVCKVICAFWKANDLNGNLKPYKPAYKAKNVSKDAFTDEEVRQLIEAAEGRGQFALATAIGLSSIYAFRLSTLVQGRWSEIEGNIWRTTSKGAKVLTVEIAENDRKRLQSLREKYNTEYLIPNTKNPSAPLQSDSLERAFKRLLGVVFGDEKAKRYSFHSLRHTAAMRTYRITAERKGLLEGVRAVQRLLGHSDMATTLHYLDHKIPMEELAEITRQLSAETW